MVHICGVDQFESSVMSDYNPDNLVYNPEKFASLSKSDIGRRLWGFLTEKNTVACLEGASNAGKPAVEGICNDLLHRFGEDALVNRNKQMIGHMVRQILEQRDWVFDQGDVKVQSVPFIKAARYRRTSWITFHAFRNASDPRDVAITDRRNDPSLPDDARWIYYATFMSPIQAAIGFGIRDFHQLRQDVLAKGYKRVHVERMLRPK